VFQDPNVLKHRLTAVGPPAARVIYARLANERTFQGRFFWKGRKGWYRLCYHTEWVVGGGDSVGSGLGFEVTISTRWLGQSVSGWGMCWKVGQGSGSSSSSYSCWLSLATAASRGYGGYGSKRTCISSAPRPYSMVVEKLLLLAFTLVVRRKKIPSLYTEILGEWLF